MHMKSLELLYIFAIYVRTHKNSRASVPKSRAFQIPVIMLQFSGIVLAVIVFLPYLKSQCINCTDHWKETCQITNPGYYCTRGAIVFRNELSPEALATSTPDSRDMYDSCVPYPFQLKYNDNYCCFWSQDMGCQLTLHPRKYNYGNPKRRCHFCNSICPCDRGVVLKSVNCIILSIITMLLMQFL